ncbi:MAG TPA: hypothetical protein VFL79_13570 [Terriglobia bacterium]|nr:hypothetical protein [Terriglobia bacterium]
MCNQSVGLIASIIEKAGTPTVGISLLKMVTRKVRPPRSLYVPFPFGYPLGKPNDPKLQHQIVREALDLLESPDELPILRNFASA